MQQIKIQIENNNIAAIFGSYDENIKKIEKAFLVNIINRNEDIIISGNKENIEKASKILNSLIIMANKNEITAQTLDYLISEVSNKNFEQIKNMSDSFICLTLSGKTIKAKTLGQKYYIDAIKKNTIVFGIGPAGTGKTYLAMAMAITAFKNNEVSRIILTRPAIEAGEHLGFLPGDLQQKVDPYLRPLYDALYEIMGSESFTKNMERGLIEVAPLAYMRGRTLDNAFIILDEAQNTTKEQMKMFLTRIGFGSKAIITGDLTQIDLLDGKKSGLKDAIKILDNIENIKICKLTNKDVVRHPLVQKIIGAYEKLEKQKQSKLKKLGKIDRKRLK